MPEKDLERELEELKAKWNLVYSIQDKFLKIFGEIEGEILNDILETKKKIKERSTQDESH